MSVLRVACWLCACVRVLRVCGCRESAHLLCACGCVLCLCCVHARVLCGCTLRCVCCVDVRRQAAPEPLADAAADVDNVDLVGPPPAVVRPVDVDAVAGAAAVAVPVAHDACDGPAAAAPSQPPAAPGSLAVRRAPVVRRPATPRGHATFFFFLELFWRLFLRAFLSAALRFFMHLGVEGKPRFQPFSPAPSEPRACYGPFADCGCWRGVRSDTLRPLADLAVPRNRVMPIWQSVSWHLFVCCGSFARMHIRAPLGRHNCGPSEFPQHSLHTASDVCGCAAVGGRSSATRRCGGRGGLRQLGT